MKSSYLANINYGDIFKIISVIKNPKKIVEFGILEGFSLSQFVNNVHNDCIIHAYDIFDEFDGNHANKENITNKFEKNKNVIIDYGNFYTIYDKFENNTIDILHVDIANDGVTYQFVLDHYVDKIKDDGIIILEGGSDERDKVEWMIKYNKIPIKQIMNNNRLDIHCVTIGTIPSMTIVTKNKDFMIRELEKKDIDNGYYDIINHFTKNIDMTQRENIINNYELFQNQFIKTFVVLYCEKIVASGRIILEPKAHNNFKYVGHIEDIIVDKNYRHNKIGTILIKKLLDIGKRICYKIVLNCNKENVEFYNKLGFTEKGIEMCIYNS